MTDSGKKQAQENARDDLHDSSLRTGFSDTGRNARADTSRAQCAETDEFFQERGGPRSVSGQSIDDAMKTESKNCKTSPLASRSGRGISNLWMSARRDCAKLRRLHCSGDDLK